MAMRQVCPSLSFAGAQRRADKRQQDALREAILQHANPNSDYWDEKETEQVERLCSLLPDYITRQELGECLDLWTAQTTMKARAEGFKAGADYLDACKRAGACAANMDDLLSKIRGRFFHAANVEDAEWTAESEHGADMRAETTGR